MITPVVLYIPPGLSVPYWWDILAEWAAQRGWAASGVVQDWPELVSLLGGGHYQFAVAATEAHLPVGRQPRLVIADRWGRPQQPGPRRPTIHQPSPGDWPRPL